MWRMILCAFSLSYGNSISEDTQWIVSRGATQLFVSSSGEKIGFHIYGSLWVVPVEGGIAKRLTNGEGFDSAGVFSPDDNYIAYWRNGPGGGQLRLIDFRLQNDRLISPLRPFTEQNAGRETRFTGTLSDKFKFVSTSGELLSTTAGGDVVVLDLFNYESEIVPGVVFLGNFSLSRDGTLALSDWPFDTLAPPKMPSALDEIAQMELSRISIIDLASRSIKSILRSQHVSYTFPQFSVDERSVFFVEVDGGIERIIEMDLDGQNRRVLSQSKYKGTEIAVHPDGQSLVLIENGQLYRFAIDSGVRTPIPFEASFELTSTVDQPILLKNANVFTGTDENVLQNASVLIVDGRIQKVSATQNDIVDGIRAKILDVQGQFLMTGLVDAHAHASFQPPLIMRELLFEGITTIIDPATAYPTTIDQRFASQSRQKPGPRVFSFSPIVDGVGTTVSARLSGPTALIRDAERVKGIVEHYHLLGFDGIKIYSALSPSVSEATIQEAKERGMLVIGHLGATTWREAVDFGIDSIVHMHPFLCNERFSGAGNRERQFEEPDYQCLESVFEDMAELGVTFDPTLVDVTRYLRPDFNDPNMSVDFRNPERTYLEEYKTHSKILQMAFEAGVNIVVGRDDWGWSLVYEMEAYEQIGIPNAEILRMATINAARFLGKGNDFGTVEVGKRADLIVIDGDPVTTIGDLRNLSMVIKDGVVVVDRSAN